MQSTWEFELPDVHILAEVEQGGALLSCFSPCPVAKYPFHGLFSAMCFAFLCSLLVILLFKMVQLVQHSQC